MNRFQTCCQAIFLSILCSNAWALEPDCHLPLQMIGKGTLGFTAQQLAGQLSTNYPVIFSESFRKIALEEAKSLTLDPVTYVDEVRKYRASGAKEPPQTLLDLTNRVWTKTLNTLFPGFKELALDNSDARGILERQKEMEATAAKFGMSVDQFNQALRLCRAINQDTIAKQMVLQLLQNSMPEYLKIAESMENQVRFKSKKSVLSFFTQGGYQELLIFAGITAVTEGAIWIARANLNSVPHQAYLYGLAGALAPYVLHQSLFLYNRFLNIVSKPQGRAAGLRLLQNTSSEPFLDSNRYVVLTSHIEAEQTAQKPLRAHLDFPDYVLTNLNDILNHTKLESAQKFGWELIRATGVISEEVIVRSVDVEEPETWSALQQITEEIIRDLGANRNVDRLAAVRTLKPAIEHLTEGQQSLFLELAHLQKKLEIIQTKLVSFVENGRNNLATLMGSRNEEEFSGEELRYITVLNSRIQELEMLSSVVIQSHSLLVELEQAVGQRQELLSAFRNFLITLPANRIRTFKPEDRPYFEALRPLWTPAPPQ